MGLSNQDERSGSTKPIFSKDVLRLEISGPEEEHLSVIDVPGIFKNTTPGFTTKADIALVRQMVQVYMENPRSVMLTVIPANVDVATQEILELASDADPDGHRTLGVLTKPDIVDEGAEPRVMDLVLGRAHVMKLGWHLVRNLGQKQLSDQSCDRQSEENKFFETKAPWNSLEKSRVGIRALRIRLQDILATHIRREFPKV
jgi:Dynamin family/Dynamin central region